MPYFFITDRRGLTRPKRSHSSKMLYKPNFCCNCGEKIDRAEWRLLDSRRFCPLCETEFKGADYLPRFAVAAGLVLSLFGFSSMLSGGNQRTVPTVNPTPKAALKPTPTKPEFPANTEVNRPPEAPLVVGDFPPQTREQPENASEPSDKPAFYCGAPTKKGTPCSRKVKVKGTRCWQHADK